MLRLALCVGALACLFAAESLAVSCSDEDQCTEGYYCEKDSHSCRKCLSCTDLKRETTLTTNACIKSVAECGECFKGLVVDRMGDVNAACVMPGSESAESVGIPPYAWWIGSIVLIFLALMIGIIVYVCINPEIFEHFKLGGNGPSGTLSTNIVTETRASAPEAPPPYSPAHYNDVPYLAVRTESPCPPHNEMGHGENVSFEEDGPFIKPSTAVRRPGAWEAAGNQNARVYNPPIYEREEEHPSVETPTVVEVMDPGHDEPTVASTWSANGYNNGDVNANTSEIHASPSETTVDLSAMLAAARETSLIDSSRPKRLCVRPNSNYNNQDSSPGDDSPPGNFPGNHNGPSYNIITKVTNVVQFNQ